MASFQVTTPSARLRALKPGESIEVPYTVANVSAGARRGSFSVKAKESEAAGWYSIKGAPSADFSAGATQQVTVVVSPPPTAAPKETYSFHLFVGLSGQEDTDFADGQDVTFAVTAGERKPFPWWIVIAAVVLLAIVAGVVKVVTTPPEPSPTPTPIPTSSPTPVGIRVPSEIIGLPFEKAVAYMGLSPRDVSGNRIQVCGDLNTPVERTQPAVGEMLAFNQTLSLKLHNCLDIIYVPWATLKTRHVFPISKPT